jgi:hypothetical protein
MLEYEILDSYENVRFAINFCNHRSTRKEMIELAREFKVPVRNVVSLEDYFGELHTVAMDAVGRYWVEFIDFASIIHRSIENGELKLVKTKNGYSVVKLY